MFIDEACTYFGFMFLITVWNIRSEINRVCLQSTDTITLISKQWLKLMLNTKACCLHTVIHIQPRTMRRAINANIKRNPIALYYIMINPKRYTSVSWKKWNQWNSRKMFINETIISYRNCLLYQVCCQCPCR